MEVEGKLILSISIFYNASKFKNLDLKEHNLLVSSLGLFDSAIGTGTNYKQYNLHFNLLKK